MSRLVTKPTKWHVRSAKTQISLGIRPVWWASAQSDRSLRCPHEETLGPQLHIERTAETLIRLGGCPGWSESSLGAQSFCGFVMRRLICIWISASSLGPFLPNFIEVEGAYWFRPVCDWVGWWVGGFIRNACIRPRMVRDRILKFNIMECAWKIREPVFVGRTCHCWVTGGIPPFRPFFDV